MYGGFWPALQCPVTYGHGVTRLRYFVHGPTYVDERVVMHDETYGRFANRPYCYLMKDLYTVAGLADDRGWPVKLYDYDAYGGVVMQRGEE